MPLLLLIILFLLILLLSAFLNPDHIQHGGMLMGPFSLLSEKEMEGIEHVSLSGKVNAKSNPVRPILMKDKSPITYYGHGIPLYPVEPGPLIGPLKLPHNTKIASSLSCCPSPYSSDQGCFCGAYEEISKALNNV